MVNPGHKEVEITDRSRRAGKTGKDRHPKSTSYEQYVDHTYRNSIMTVCYTRKQAAPWLMYQCV